MQIQSGCNCGAIVLTMKSLPYTSVMCHCMDCRRFTGALAATYVPYMRSDVVVRGEPKVWGTKADSGRRFDRYFCGDCGSSVFDVGEHYPNLLFLHGGTLPPGSVPPPHIDIYLRNAESWEPRVEGSNNYDGMPTEGYA